MYVTTYADLQRELQSRFKHQKEARERVNAFIKRQYGILNGVGATRHYFGLNGTETPRAFLARQIASICAEDVAFTIGSEKMGLRPLTATFVRDMFSNHNHDKLHRAKIPWVSWSKKGNMITKYDRVVPDTHLLNGTTLENVQCLNGKSLPEYHLELRRRAAISGEVIDVSDFHSYMLMNAAYPPSNFYKEEGTRQVFTQRTEEISFSHRDRPPATWYYPYYLSWFIDGSMVLFETYDNPDSCVPQIEGEFKKDMEFILKETGFLPLVVKIPPLSKELLACNRHFLERDAFSELAASVTSVDTNDTVSFFSSIAESALRFR